MTHDRAATPVTLTAGHKLVLSVVKELGLGVEEEVRFERYTVDCYLPEVHAAVEFDGKNYHSSPKQRERDAVRDKWLWDNAALPVFRVTDDKLKNLEQRSLLSADLKRWAEALGDSRDDRYSTGKKFL